MEFTYIFFLIIVGKKITITFHGCRSDESQDDFQYIKKKESK